MTRKVPAFDPKGSRAERRGFIRTEPISLPPADGSIGTEEPSITLWAGPKVLFINAFFPGIDLDTLQIRVAGNRVVFSGPLYPEPADPMPGKHGVRRNPIPFSHFLPKTFSGWLFQELIKGNFINVQSALMRRRCLKSVPGFDEDLGVLEDWWYWIQLSRSHRFL